MVKKYLDEVPAELHVEALSPEKEVTQRRRI
jgi:hypothetical protein